MADLVTKRLVEANLLLGQTIPIIPDVFHLTRVANPGAAFGLFPVGPVALAAVAALVAVVILVVGPVLARNSSVLRLGLGLQLGGALGNLVDRLRIGLVTDFLDFRFWPVFNIADMAIVAGAGLLVLGYFKTTGRS